MKRLLIALVMTLCMSLTPANVRAQNLIQNGSFELPGIPGGQEPVGAGSTAITSWTIANGYVYLHKSPDIDITSFTPAQDGSIYLDLSGNGAPQGTVYQDFSSTPSIQYSLSFYIGASSWNNPSASINVQLHGTQELLNENLTPIAPNANGINWLEESFSFTPDSTTIRLSFADISGFDDNASFIDNVSVSIVPEPTVLLPMGLILLVIRRRH